MLSLEKLANMASVLNKRETAAWIAEHQDDQTEILGGKGGMYPSYAEKIDELIKAENALIIAAYEHHQEFGTEQLRPNRGEHMADRSRDHSIDTAPYYPSGELTSIAGDFSVAVHRARECGMPLEMDEGIDVAAQVVANIRHSLDRENAKAQTRTAER